ncbi:response regulator transcription factor [Bordetella sp. BOR01]|uniref:response regulator transcription factor n=1 Tax=Bordetella sp. BOR01 TaxID=2854779 RepID=UPI001C4532C5|nr:response regulator transcription factor [Bordetella sp. BOR01]MBV7483412.1 response regulator transcription factor [Bordetella sp. BOR01]
MARVLIVEDEPQLRRDLVEFLALCDLAAAGVATAAGLRQALADGDSPDVIVLDVGLPDGNGFELAAEIRPRYRGGIIMLTAFGGSDDRIRGFESGADIYLVKYSSLREIEAAIRSLLRRTENHATAARDNWVLDSRNWALTAPNQRSINLTATEFALVNLLCRHGGDVCERQKLVDTLARPKTHFDSQHLDAVVSRLRRKIGDRADLPVPIKAIYGVGYTFTAPVIIR